MFQNISLILLITITLAFSYSHGIENNIQKSELEQQQVYFNPILDFSAPDPYIILHNNSYFMAQRLPNDGDTIGIRLFSSQKLTDFREAKSEIIYRAPSGMYNLWAPEIHRLNNNWYIYFALDDGNNKNHRMYVIQALDSQDPFGEYSKEIRLSTPSEDYWAIDGTVMQLNEKLFFIWSGWPKLDSEFPQNLYIASMSDPFNISSQRVLLREPKFEWEMRGAPILEGPQILVRNSEIFLIFSASGSWTPDYCLGMMGINYNENLLDPTKWWHKTDDCVFYRNDENSVFGTGHASFTTSKNSSTDSWIVYHAMEDKNGGWNNRTARVEKFYWDENDFPIFPRPSSLNSPLLI